MRAELIVCVALDNSGLLFPVITMAYLKLPVRIIRGCHAFCYDPLQWVSDPHIREHIWYVNF